MLVMLFFSFISLTSFAPSTNIISIPKFESIKAPVSNSYEPLIEAIFRWETRGMPDSLAYKAHNKAEGAFGGLQIRQCRIEHYNQLTGKNYTLTDMYDFNKSKEVFLYFAQGKTYEHAAKDWNGSGPLTIKYWEAVKALL